jgi:response regulator of citrate/malate metabolism
MQTTRTRLEKKFEAQGEKARHLLKNRKAAFRLLEGAVVLGHVKVEDAKSMAKKIAVMDGVPITFADEFFKNFEKEHAAIDELRTKYNCKALDLGHTSIVVADDQSEASGWNELFRLIFNRNSIKGAQNFTDLKKAIEDKKNSAFCVLVDLKFPNNEYEGIEAIEYLSINYPQIPVVVFSATDSVNFAKIAFSSGAWDYFTKEPHEAEFKYAADYYLTFHKMMSNYLSYHQNYLKVYWERIKKISEAVTTTAESELLFTKVRHHLVKSFRTLANSEGLLFYQGGINVEDSYEEVIFQAASAVDIFSGMLMNANKIKPKENASGQFENLSLFEAIFLLQKKWVVRERDKLSNADIKKISQWRNFVSHQMDFDNSNSKFKLRKPATLSQAKEYLEICLKFIEYYNYQLAGKKSSR